MSAIKDVERKAMGARHSVVLLLRARGPWVACVQVCSAIDRYSLGGDWGVWASMTRRQTGGRGVLRRKTGAGEGEMIIGSYSRTLFPSSFDGECTARRSRRA